MRLIDIDKHFEINKIFYDADLKMPLHRVKLVLENTPTINAIPIEWMKGKQNKYWGNYEFAKTISQLLEMWEKENETN